MKYVIRRVPNGPIGPGVSDDAYWLASYDPDAFNGMGSIEWTDDPDRAKRFDTFTLAAEEWKRQSTVRPLRADGLPNRPLSAFTITIEVVDPD